MSLNNTPNANRVHIGFYGKRNSGKSSLINSFVGQEVAIVSAIPGTTTDPVYKPMEIQGIGACVLIDTAGFDDAGSLGEMRVEKTTKAAEKTDIAVLLFSEEDIEKELEWFKLFKERNTPVLCVISKGDIITDIVSLQRSIKEKTGVNPIIFNRQDSANIEVFKEALIRLVPEDYEMPSITSNLVNEDDIVMLVMPQDIQAPKGRLILPQVQTIRDLLDNKCIVISTTTDKLDQALAALSKPPRVIITDSQVFKTVYDKKPAESLLTSFSVLFAAYKGDLSYYIKGAAVIDKLTERSRVLIAECCSHAPLTEDIGRVKLPNALRK
ncbi:MAG TPA: [FeFe] hydrogenase H-cluster maturation GTPase HydF, partial [Clostridiales bacterium]|nr:[FeFe] hydrogenase H-cluster maturation GTPase HydF [Clostridiales bacterium]